jgi:subtilisin
VPAVAVPAVGVPSAAAAIPEEDVYRIPPSCLVAPVSAEDTAAHGVREGEAISSIMLWALPDSYGTSSYYKPGCNPLPQVRGSNGALYFDHATAQHTFVPCEPLFGDRCFWIKDPGGGFERFALVKNTSGLGHGYEPGGGGGEPPPPAPGEQRHVVLLRTPGGGADPAAIKAARAEARRVAGAAGTRALRTFGSAVSAYTANLTAAQVDALRASPEVAAVVLDAPQPPDRVGGAFDDSTITLPAGQTVPSGVRRVGGERSSAVSGDGQGEVAVDVAVLDSGVDAHPELDVVGGVNCSGHGEPAAYGEGGRVHGTKSAGVIGARDDDQGVVGVAPGARLWSVRAVRPTLPEEAAAGFPHDLLLTPSALVCAFDWLAANANQVRVASASVSLWADAPLTTTDCSPVVDDSGVETVRAAVCRATAAGVTIVTSASNESEVVTQNYPAAFDEVITVSALADYDGVPGSAGSPPAGCPNSGGDTDDWMADFSNHGPRIDMIAPGTCYPSTSAHAGYGWYGGTSGAAPHVAGAAALFVAANPAATPAEVRAHLLARGSLEWEGASDLEYLITNTGVVQEPLVNVAE